MRPNRVWVFSDLIEKNKRQFKIPVYQRNYDWSNIECEKLYEDIIKANERDHKHFTGTIVYIADSYNSSLDEALIIDGQQRFTTMYILLKAMYDIAKMKQSVRIEEEIKDVMFNRNCDEKYKIKLKPIKSDDEQLTLLIKDKFDDMDRNSNIFKNYITFKNRIEDTLQNNLELADILNGIKKLEMVEIVLDKNEGDEPQKIFESINSTGLELSLADLIRNYLLMDDDNQDELYEDYWLEIEKNVGYRNLGDYVINYLTSKISKSVNSKNAYRLFKEHCDEKNLSHEDVLKDLRKTSKYYGAFIGVNSYYSSEITSYLNAFYTIKQTTILPLIFKLFNDYENENIDESTLCKVLDYWLTYLVRITACEINKNLSKFLKSVYDRVISNSYENYYEKFVVFLNGLRANDRMPTDEEFKDALMYKPLYKKPICKYVLSVIENSTKEHIDISTLTIEHILPQKENAAVWRSEIGDDYKRVYEIYLHTLGNLTFTGNNSELGTKPFNEKKKIIEENSKANILNCKVLSCDRWNEDTIVDRAKALSNILVKSFPYNDLQSSIIKNDKKAFKVDASIDFSNSKPDGFTFIGEYSKVTSWVDMLSKFLHLAYDLDSISITELANNNYSIPSASNVYISNDSRKLRKSKQINNTGIHYETNLSSNNIISFIKNLIIEMKLDLDDFDFFLSEIPFSLTNEETWEEGLIPVAQLFYNFVEHLIDVGKLQRDEIKLLKDKDYTKSHFSNTDYPAFADNRKDNMGKSTNIRYRKKPLVFDDNNLFVSTQFFDSDRDKVIEWYKKHL